MSEDLYEAISPANADTASAVESASESSQGFFPLSIPPLETILTHLLIFTLVWTISYSLFFMIWFFFYNVKHHDRESPRLKQGYEDGYLAAVKIWASNLAFILILGLYALLRTSSTRYFWGFVAIGAFLVKVFYYDLKLIPGIKDKVQEIYGGIGAFLKKITQKPKPPAE